MNVAREFNNKSGPALDGILIVELKAFSPHCDPTDDFEAALVSTAVSEIQQNKMDSLVMFDSFSPALLSLAAQIAPAIPRELDLDWLQLLTAAPIEYVTRLSVTIMNN